MISIAASLHRQLTAHCSVEEFYEDQMKYIVGAYIERVGEQTFDQKEMLPFTVILSCWAL